MMRATETQEDGKPVVNGSNLLSLEFAERPSDAPLVDGSDVVYERERLLREAALARGQRWIEKSFGWSPGYWYYANKREPLVRNALRIAYNYTGPDASLFASQCWT